MDLRNSIRSIRNPVLVIVGRHDPATVPAAGHLIASSIPGARVVTLDAAHMSNMEDRVGFTDSVVSFLLGKTVGEAFWRMFHLEMACRLQMDVLATGRPFIEQPPEVCAKVRQQYLTDFYPGLYEWPALLRKLDKLAPDYAE